jgi:hypothetical protein
MQAAAPPSNEMDSGKMPAADPVDERFEYDAPRFHDFEEGSPPGAAAADSWFDTEGPKGVLSA